MFKLCDALLDIFGDFAQDDVLLSLVLGQTLNAVEVAADAVAELNFVLRMRIAEEFLWVKVESSDCFWSFYRSCGLEFIKGSGRGGVEVPILLIVGVNLRLALLVDFE